MRSLKYKISSSWVSNIPEKLAEANINSLWENASLTQVLRTPSNRVPKMKSSQEERKRGQTETAAAENQEKQHTVKPAHSRKDTGIIKHRNKILVFNKQ